MSETTMGAHEAFRRLVRSAEKRFRGTPMRRATLIGADFIAQMSGSWHPDDMIWSTDPKLYESLQKMLKEEGIG